MILLDSFHLGMVRHVPKYAVVEAVFEALNSDNESLISPYLSSTLSTISALPHPLQSLAKAFTATTAATLLTSPIDAIYLEYVLLLFFTFSHHCAEGGFHQLVLYSGPISSIFLSIY